MTNKEIFAQNLNYYMLVNNKSRKEVADAIDVSYFTYTDWVKGKKFPRMDKVENLAKYFGIKISDLVEKHSVEEKPSETAILHAQMIQDEDLNQLYVYYKSLNAKKRTIVLDLVRNLAED